MFAENQKKIFTILGVAAFASMNAQVVINEVYGGGGNSGSTYRHDFIELKNIGTTPVSIGAYTLQYAAATSTFNVYHELPNVTLAPGQIFVVREAAGAGTTQIDTPADFIPTALINFNGNPSTDSVFNMGGTNLKVALASNATQVTSPTDANVVDFVGVGTANQYEGAGAAPAMSNSLSAQRIAGDTNNNAVDFQVAAPTPGTAYLAIADVTSIKSSLVKNTNIKDEVVFGAKSNDVKVFNMLGQVVKTASVKENETMNVSDLKAGAYIVTGTVNNEGVSQKVIKN